ncbi:MAG: hypothetical protein WBM50_27495, partial [Acidimicrobiales bacterium]
MSGNPGGFKKVDNLTPFEYALAGVAVPEAEETPSISVISDMRQLAAEVQDAPISQPRLREFLQTGGSIAKRNDRRSVRRRRAAEAGAAMEMPDEGGFIDITPVELTSPAESPMAEPVAEPVAETPIPVPVAGSVDEASANGPDPAEHHDPAEDRDVTEHHDPAEDHDLTEHHDVVEHRDVGEHHDVVEHRDVGEHHDLAENRDLAENHDLYGDENHDLDEDHDFDKIDAIHASIQAELQGLQPPAPPEPAHEFEVFQSSVVPEAPAFPAGQPLAEQPPVPAQT